MSATALAREIAQRSRAVAEELPSRTLTVTLFDVWAKCLAW